MHPLRERSGRASDLRPRLLVGFANSLPENLSYPGEVLRFTTLKTYPTCAAVSAGTVVEGPLTGPHTSVYGPEEHLACLYQRRIHNQLPHQGGL